LPQTWNVNGAGTAAKTRHSTPTQLLMDSYMLKQWLRLLDMTERFGVQELMCSYSTAQHSTAQHSTAQHSTAQHSTAQHSTAQRRTQASAQSLTKNTSSQIPEPDVPVPSITMKATEAAVAVEGQETKQDEEGWASTPSQECHDQIWVPQDEGIVQGSNHVRTNLPWGICITSGFGLWRMPRHIMQLRCMLPSMLSCRQAKICRAGLQYKQAWCMEGTVAVIT